MQAVLRRDASIAQSVIEGQGIDRTFYMNLVQLEQDMMNSNYEFGYVNSVIDMYMKLVEHYDSIPDPISIYFQEKIQVTLANKKTILSLTKHHEQEESRTNAGDGSARRASGAYVNGAFSHAHGHGGGGNSSSNNAAGGTFQRDDDSQPDSAHGRRSATRRTKHARNDSLSRQSFFEVGDLGNSDEEGDAFTDRIELQQQRARRQQQQQQARGGAKPGLTQEQSRLRRNKVAQLEIQLTTEKKNQKEQIQDLFKKLEKSETFVLEVAQKEIQTQIEHIKQKKHLRKQVARYKHLQKTSVFYQPSEVHAVFTTSPQSDHTLKGVGNQAAPQDLQQQYAVHQEIEELDIPVEEEVMEEDEYDTDSCAAAGGAAAAGSEQQKYDKKSGGSALGDAAPPDPLQDALGAGYLQQQQQKQKDDNGQEDGEIYI